VLSTIGAFLLGFGLLLAAVVLIVSLFKGRKAPAIPWGAATLEWQCSSPPPLANFEKTPTVGNPYDMQSVVWDPDTESFVERKEVPVEPEKTEPAPV